MKYTFILPAYKTHFLRESLRSILDQTVPDFEILVSDDASPEPVKAMVDEFKDSRISYSRNAVNIGSKRLVDHWNQILDKAAGDFVIVASDDDLYAPDFLEKIGHLAEKYPGTDVFAGRCKEIDSDGREIRTEVRHPEFMSQAELLADLPSSENILCIGSCVFRTSALRKAGGFVQMPYAWKSDSATRLMMAKNGIACTDEPVFSFRMSGENISSGKVNPEMCKGKIKAALEFKKWMDANLGGLPYGNILKRLEGETRSYYQVLSPVEFCKLYRTLSSDGWFRSMRNRVSFAAYYLRKKLFS